MSQVRYAFELFLFATGVFLLGANSAPADRPAWLATVAVMVLLLALLRYLARKNRTDPPKAQRVSDPTQQGQPAQRAVVANGMAYALFANQGQHQVHRYDGTSWRPLASEMLTEPCTSVTVAEDAPPAVYAWRRTGVWRAPKDPTSAFTLVPFEASIPSPEIERLGALGQELFAMVTTDGARCIAWRGNPSDSMRRLPNITPDDSTQLEPVLGTNGPFVALVNREQRKEQLVLATAAGRDVLHTATDIAMVTATPTQVVFAASGARGQRQLWRLTAPFVPVGGAQPQPPTLVADNPMLARRHDSAVVTVVGKPGSMKFLLVPATGAPNELPVATDPGIDEVIGLAIEHGSLHALVLSHGSLLFLQQNGTTMAVRGTGMAMTPAPTEFVVAGTTMACCNGTDVLVCRSSVVTRMRMLDEFNQALSAPRHLFASGGKVYFEATQGTTRAVYRLTD